MSKPAPPAAPSSGTGPTVSVRRRRAAILGLAAIVVVVDQVTKTFALHHYSAAPKHVIWTLRLYVTFNSGAAFGLGQGSTAVLVGGAIVLVVILLGLGRRASRNASLTTSVAMGLLLGGAVGNLVDRLIRHHNRSVIDFIDLRWWPVFNVADASITVGAVLLVVAGLLNRPKASRPG
jgi:signal peptidase II